MGRQTLPFSAPFSASRRRRRRIREITGGSAIRFAPAFPSGQDDAGAVRQFGAWLADAQPDFAARPVPQPLLAPDDRGARGGRLLALVVARHVRASGFSGIIAACREQPTLASG